MKPPTRQIAAVHDEDLQAFLQRLGVWSDLVEGRVKCWSCSKTVTVDTLSAVFPIDDGVAVVCDDRACYERVLAERG